jgi:hypothetical protein
VKRSTYLVLFEAGTRTCAGLDVAFVFRGASARSTHRWTSRLSAHQKCLGPSPSTFGFDPFQQMVRRYEGIEIAGPVFVTARRVLADPENTN